MKNHSKEFCLGNLSVTVGTHWDDWALPLRIQWSSWKSHTDGWPRSTDIFVEILCFTFIIEIFRDTK